MICNWGKLIIRCMSQLKLIYWGKSKVEVICKTALHWKAQPADRISSLCFLRHRAVTRVKQVYAKQRSCVFSPPEDSGSKPCFQRCVTLIRHRLFWELGNLSPQRKISQREGGGRCWWKIWRWISLKPGLTIEFVDCLGNSTTSITTVGNPSIWALIAVWHKPKLFQLSLSSFQ